MISCAALGGALAFSVQRASPAVATAALAHLQDTATASAVVSRANAKVVVENDHVSLVKLECLGSAACHGELMLLWKGSQPQADGQVRTATIGSASFSIPANTTRLIKLDVDAAGHALLQNAHGHIAAVLTLDAPPVSAQ